MDIWMMDGWIGEYIYNNGMMDGWMMDGCMYEWWMDVYEWMYIWINYLMKGGREGRK